jgi:hypothetical protein
MKKPEIWELKDLKSLPSIMTSVSSEKARESLF